MNHINFKTSTQLTLNNIINEIGFIVALGLGW